MPIYEYICDKCDTKFEIMRGITSENEEIKCPKCGTKEPKKVFSVICGRNHGADHGNLRFPT